MFPPLRATWVFAAAFLLDASAGAQVVRDGSLGPGPDVQANGPHYVITESMGARPASGPNLFHSFRDFSFGGPVGSPESVHFSAGSGVRNILARVTGGQVSEIDGRLGSDASLTLLNPAGVLFGSRARLDVNGSFRATTADTVVFEDGMSLAATVHPDSTLSVASPVAFGFLVDRGSNRSSVGEIRVARAVLQVPDERMLALYGGDITIEGDSGDSLVAPGGNANLVSMRSPGFIRESLHRTGTTIDAAELGNIELSSVAGIDVGRVDGDAGDVTIRAGALSLESSFISARGGSGFVQDPGEGRRGGGIRLAIDGDVALGSSALILDGGAAGDLRIDAGSVVLDDSWISADRLGDLDGGSITIRALGDLDIRNGSSIYSSTTYAGTKAPAIHLSGGDVRIASNGGIESIVTREGSSADVAIYGSRSVVVGCGTSACGNDTIRTTASGGGNGGDVTITAPVVRFDRGMIATASTQYGDGGDIRIAASEILIENDSGLETRNIALLGDPPESSDPDALGTSGSIFLEAADGIIRVQDSHLESRAQDTGDGGSIFLDAGSVLLIDSLLQADSFVGGAAGNVDVEAGDIVLQRSQILTDTTGGVGAGGNIRLAAADDLRISDDQFALSSESSLGSGKAGDIDLSGRTVIISGAAISTFTYSDGDGGDVTIRAEDLHIEGRSAVSTGTFGSRDAGDIDVAAGRSVLIEGPSAATAFGLFGLEAISLGVGAAGSISVSAPSIFVNRRAQISATASDSGRGGDIRLVSSHILLDGGAQVISDTHGAGQGGNVSIVADSDVVVRDLRSIAIGRPGTPPDRLVQNGATNISTSSLRATGNAGSVRVDAPRVLVEGGVIQALTDNITEPGVNSIVFGPSPARNGDAGAVIVRAGQIEVLAGGAIASTSFGSGSGGQVDLEATGTISVRGKGVRGRPSLVTASTFRTGAGGSVGIAADQLRVVEGGRISATTSGIGPGGDIGIGVRELHLESGGTITAASQFAGSAGRIGITAREGVLLRDASVLAESKDAAGGSVSIRAGRIVDVAHASVAATTTGRGAGGSVFVEGPVVRVRQGAEIAARSLGSGDAGSVAVHGDREIRLSDGRITVEARNGSGGDIELVSRTLIALDRSDVTASVASGSGGNVVIDPTFVLLDNGSRIVAEAVTGRGGRIEITADVLLVSLDSLISASSDFGVNGVVEIDSPQADLAGTLAALPGTFLAEVDLVRSRCSGPTAHSPSGTFVLVDPMGVDPEAPLGADLRESGIVMGRTAGENTVTWLVPCHRATPTTAHDHPEVLSGPRG